MKSIRVFIDAAPQYASTLDLLSWVAHQDSIESIEFVTITQREGSQENQSHFAPRPPLNLLSKIRTFSFVHLMHLEKVFLKNQSNFNKCVEQISLDVPLAQLIESFKVHAKQVTRTYSELLVDKYVECDLSVWLTSAEVPSAVRSNSKNGVISIWRPTVAGNETSLPIFESVAAQSPFCSFQICIEGGKLSEQQVIFSGRCATEFLVSASGFRGNAYAMHYLKLTLSSLLDGESLPPQRYAIDQELVTPAIPSIYLQANYVLSVATRFIRNKIRRLCGWSGFPAWEVYFSSTNWKDVGLHDHKSFPLNPRTFIADPFLVDVGGATYCFVEELPLDSERGLISVYQVSSSEATYLGPAISEPFHMSFPYLFYYQDKLYMCPEISQSREIRLYECIDFPLQWQHSNTLMREVAAADTMIFHHDELWWMFTNFDPIRADDYCVELNIFWSEDPTSSDWIPHSMNPILVDSTRARNGGLLVDEEGIHRVAQSQGFARYGESMQIFKIDELTKTRYSEHAVKAFTQNVLGTKNGVHHMNSNGSITVFDGQ